jgi:hypothetical protein
MADDSDPPRVFYQLKPREFERVNALSGSSTPDAPPSDENPAPPAPAKIDIHDLYAQAAIPGRVLATGERVGAKNEVHVILKENLNQANAAGLNHLAPKPKRRSRRTRDYLLVLISLNAFFSFAAFGPYSNAVTLAYGVAGIIFSTLGLTWVMYFVMDDY